MGVRLVIKDEVNIKFENLPLDARKKLVAAFKFEDPTARYRPAFKLGRWDGTVSLFGLGGTGYLNNLEKILDILSKMGIDIDDIDDQRTHYTLDFTPVTETYWADQGKVWPEGHTMQGQPIMLRDYQVDAINKFLTNTQALQEIATGAGKCLAYETAISVDINPNTAFGKFMDCDRISLPIGKLAEHIEDFNRRVLEDNLEIDIRSFGVYIDTPTGVVQVTDFIKKYNLPLIKITFDNEYSIQVADTHKFHYQGTDIVADQLKIGDYVDHRSGTIKVVEIESAGINHCYDMSIPSPHLYYDLNGVVHHNTITTSTLAHVCEPYGRTITIVPNKSLVEQTYEDFVNVDLDVGMYYGDRKELNKTHTICTWQSLSVLDKKSKNSEHEILTLAEFLDGVCAVIVDECHTASASVLRTLLTQNLCNAPIRWGLTGTVPKQQFEYEQIFASLGPVIGGIKAHELQDAGVLSDCHVKVMQLIDLKEFKAYADEITYQVTNLDRMKYISSVIKEIAESGNTLVLVGRIESGKIITDEIEDAVFVSGNVKTKDRKTEYDEIKTASNKILVATYQVAAVGINIPRIFNLVLIEPGKSFTRVIQSIGRGIRKAHDKDFVQIYDITSTCKYAKKHLAERKKYYKEAKYEFEIKKVDWQ